MSRLLLILAVFALAGCGEGDQQVVVYKQGKYQGKPDTQPWNNDSPIAELKGGRWDKGNQASWEESIKQRQLAQHEHKRIYQ
jgi:hypothetical protein